MSLVYVERQWLFSTNVPKPQGLQAPVTQLAHFRAFPDADHQPGVGANLDTFYSFASIDLRTEPWVLSIPDMGQRFWIMQCVDGWNNVPAAPESRTVGGQGGHFALVGPQWKGTTPHGLTDLRMPTSMIWLAGRTYVAGKDDVPVVHAPQDQYTLQPLSSWGKAAYRPPDNVPVDATLDNTTPVAKQVLALGPEEFFNRLNRLLMTNPPEPDDPKMMSRIARLGIAPGETFRMETFASEVRQAIGEGFAAGVNVMRETRLGKLVNGWQITLDMGRYGTDYPSRAGWTFFGVGGNLAEYAVYPLGVMDADGHKFDAANKYLLHFSKAELPPVNAFWSLTMYNDESYLVANFDQPQRLR